MADSRCVAIIGAGPSGLAACKAALEEGLRPVIFEAAAGIGGLWRRSSGKTWDSLRTNLSKYTCVFSDYPWPDGTGEFPTGSAVQSYLESYAAAFGLRDFIRLNTRVVDLRLAGTQPTRWKLAWAAGDIERTDEFEHVIVATGIFEEPHFAVSADRFLGRVLHSSQYRDPCEFAGKRVLVVGSAFSGADIAADLSREASVTVAGQRPLWYLPRYIGGIPTDLLFYSRAAAEKSAADAEHEQILKRHHFFKSVLEEPPLPLLAPDPRKGQLPFVAISDDFVEAVKSRRVEVKPRVSELDGKCASFDDGSEQEFDVVIQATGYRLGLPFLSSHWDDLELNPRDQLQPVILHECVWPRSSIPGLAFVGMYRGPYLAAMELQARWACGVFSNRLAAPSPATLTRGLQIERDVRNKQPRPQFPHGDYVAMVDRLAQLLDVRPNSDLESTSPLRQLLHDGPFLPFHFRLRGFGQKRALALQATLACSAKHFPKLAKL